MLLPPCGTLKARTYLGICRGVLPGLPLEVAYMSEHSLGRRWLGLRNPLSLGIHNTIGVHANGRLMLGQCQLYDQESANTFSFPRLLELAAHRVWCYQLCFLNLGAQYRPLYLSVTEWLQEREACIYEGGCPEPFCRFFFFRSPLPSKFPSLLLRKKSSQMLGLCRQTNKNCWHTVWDVHRYAVLCPVILRVRQGMPSPAWARTSWLISLRHRKEPNVPKTCRQFPADLSLFHPPCWTLLDISG